MKNDNFITVMGWMANELELGGNDLLVYALIYGFSQDGDSWFTGSRQYISETLNISKMTVDRTLKKLIDKGYVIKDSIYQNDIKFNRYKVADRYVENCYTPSQNVTGVVTKCYRGVSQNVTGGGNKMLPNIDNIKHSKDNIGNIDRKQVYFPDNEELNAAFVGFVEMRKKIKKPMTDRAVELAKKKLDKLAGADDALAVEIINQSILKGWQDLYPLKDEQKGNPIYNEMKKDSWANSWANA